MSAPSTFDSTLASRLHFLQGLPPFDGSPLSEGAMQRIFAFGAPVGDYVVPDVSVHNEHIDGPHGAIPVRVYEPKTEALEGGIVWLHGGAFVAGDLDMPEADVVSRELCARLSMKVVSVDYRLAINGIKFPIPHDDVVAAFVHFATTSTSPDQWFLGGASAGGNLTAGAALHLRDNNGVTPKGLLLLYPVLHNELPPLDQELEQAMDALDGLMRFSPPMVIALNANYAGHDLQNPYAFAANGDLVGLPPTLMIASEYDDLRPSGEVFAAALARAGVSVGTRIELGVPHGHLNVPGLPGALASLAVMTEWVSSLP
jgi:acetyl esterase